MGVLRTVLVLGLLEAFGPLSMDLYMPQLPHLAASLHTSDALAQATMSVCMIGLGVGQLVAGPLSDRFGRKRPLAIGVALFALFSLASALAPTIGVLLVARTLQGLAGSAGIVISLAVARDLYSGPELSRILSLLTLVSASAPIVAPVIGGQLALIMDWRGVFVVLCGVGVALLLVAIFGLSETLPPARRHHGGLGTTRQHARALARDPLFVVIVIAAAASGTAFFSYLSMSSFVLQDQFGLSPQLFSLAFALNALCNMGGAQGSRLVVRRLGPARMYVAGQTMTLAAACAMVAVVAAHLGVVALIATLALYLLSTGIGGPNSTTLALGRHAEHAGTAAAVLGMVTFTIGPLAAPLIGLAGVTAATMSIAIGAATLISATLAWAVVRPIARRAAA